MQRRGLIVSLEAFSFEYHLARLYSLSQESNGFGITFNFQIIKEYAEEYFFINKFEAMEMLKSIYSKVSKKEDKNGK